MMPVLEAAPMVKMPNSEEGCYARGQTTHSHKAGNTVVLLHARFGDECHNAHQNESDGVI
jgi:hypothetical protein